MTYDPKRGVLLVAAVLLSACVSQSKYDDLQAQYHQLQQQNSALTAQVAADKTQICRLSGAIKYTVNSDLLFSSGGWEMSERGKQIIANMAAKLAPTQQNHVLVSGYTDNKPVGPALARQGVKPDLISAKGFGDADPVASNDTTQGRAQNRRVELSVPASGC